MGIIFLLEKYISFSAYLFSEIFQFNSEIYGPNWDFSHSVRRQTSLTPNTDEFKRLIGMFLLFLLVARCLVYILGLTVVYSSPSLLLGLGILFSIVFILTFTIYLGISKTMFNS